MKWQIGLFLLLAIGQPLIGGFSNRGDESGDDYGEPDESHSSEYNPCIPSHSDDDLCQNWRKSLNKNYVSLVELFGSNEKVQTEICDLLNTDKITYWSFDQADYAIELALDNNDDIDSETEIGISNVSIVLRNTRDEVFCNADCILCNLNEERRAVDCAVGRQARNRYFTLVENAVVNGQWQCDLAIPSLWMDLVTADYSKINCTLKQSLDALVKIRTEGEHYGNTFQPDQNTKNTNMKTLGLLLTLSNPEALQYLQRVSCEDDNLKQCDVYAKALCSFPSYELLKDITQLIENATTNHQPETIKDVYTLLDIQRNLGHAANDQTTRASVRSNAEVEAAQKMLNSYFEIIDTAVGNRSISTWKQSTDGRGVFEQFEQILLESEDFAGHASDMIFARGTHSTEVDKETVGVKMKRVRATSGDEKLEFAFDNAMIWTEDFQGDSSSNDYNVLALYYKTWHQTLEAIVNDNETTEQNRTETEISFQNETRILVGRGGIISLSSRTNQEKTSIPVYYKIKFDRQNFYGGRNGIRRRCLSCGYLDVSTRTWEGIGCNVIRVDDVGVTCQCNHTTNFAAFMSPYKRDFNTTESEELGLNILEYVGSGASLVFLLVSFVVFCVVRHHVRHDRLRVHMNLVIALFFVHLIQMFAEAAVNNNTLCILTAISTHYFLLAAFMWMLIEGIFLYIYVIQVFMLFKVENRQWMCIVGWFFPSIIVSISAGYGLPNEIYLEPRPRREEIFNCSAGQLLYPPLNDNINELKYDKCWLSTSSGMMWAFIVPALLVILFNIIILIKVVTVLVKHSKMSKQMKNFRSSSHCYPNYGFGMKTKRTAQTSSQKYASTPKQVDGTSINEEPCITQESLHGTVVTHTSNSSSPNSKPSPRDRNFSQSPLFDVSSENNFLHDAKTAVKGAAVLLPLLGIPWILGTFGYTSYALTIIFVLINSMQGVAIFLVYCYFNEEVSRVLHRQWRVYMTNHSSSSRSRASSASSLKSMSKKSLLNKRRSTEVLTISRSNIII